MSQCEKGTQIRGKKCKHNRFYLAKGKVFNFTIYCNIMINSYILIICHYVIACEISLHQLYTVKASENETNDGRIMEDNNLSIDSF